MLLNGDEMYLMVEILQMLNKPKQPILAHCLCKDDFLLESPKLLPEMFVKNMHLGMSSENQRLFCSSLSMLLWLNACLFL